MRRFTALAPALLLAAVLVGCSAPAVSTPPPVEEEPAATPDACVEAFAAADVQAREHYETGPMQVYLEDAPALPETDEEWAEYDAVIAEDEAQFAAILDPLYTVCADTAQFVEGAREYPFVVGLTGPEFIDEITLQTYCYEREDTPACSDWESFSF